MKQTKSFSPSLEATNPPWAPSLLREKRKLPLALKHKKNITRKATHKPQKKLISPYKTKPETIWFLNCLSSKTIWFYSLGLYGWVVLGKAFVALLGIFYF
jgi:hypothetical protein